MIGARSVVTHDVMPYTIVGGTPARQIRKRFSDDVISELLALRWWERSPEYIKKSIGAIRSGDIEKLKTI